MPLNREKAEEQLAKFTDSKRQTKCYARLRELPKAQSAAAFGLLGLGPEGKSLGDWQKANKARSDAARAVEQLPAAQRAKLFTAFFPSLGKMLSATWDLLARLPYLTGYERRAFRAPNSPDLSAERKGVWFQSIYNELNPYKDDALTPAWIATWSAYVGYGGADEVGLLLAAVIEAGGKEAEEVFEILKDSAAGRHATGAMGKHVTRALLVADRKDGWEFMEKLLLAAQRQEGLRQAILETVDEAHPEAFRRMVDLILDKDLVRFSSVVRAVDVWFGFGLEAISAGQVKKILTRVATYLKDAKARKAALSDTDPQAMVLALAVTAFEDAEVAVKLAGKVARDKSAGAHRLAAIHFLETLNTPASLPYLLPLMDDPDMTVALAAYSGISAIDNDDGIETPDMFERLERLVVRSPEKKIRVEWPGYGVTEDLPNREDVADALDSHIGKRAKNRLVPYLKWMNTYRRSQAVEELSKSKIIDDTTRKLFFELISDRNASVREAALAAAAKCKPTADEVRALEPLLTRKTEATRRGVVTLVVKQNPKDVVVSAERLLTSRNANVRLAGLEVLRHLSKGKLADEARQFAETYRTTHGKLSADEKRQIEQILKVERVEALPTDAFGLSDLSKRSTAPKPTPKKVKFITPTAIKIVEALDKLVHEHRETPVRFKSYSGEETEEPLGAIGWQFPSPDQSKDLDEDVARLPMREVWDKFWADRPKDQRDADGLELVRALALVHLRQWDWQRIQQGKSAALKALKATVFGDFKWKELKYDSVVTDIVRWLHRLNPPTGEADFVLDGLETIFAGLSSSDLRDGKKKERNLPEIVDFWRDAVNRADQTTWTEAQKRRHWNLEKWFDEPGERGEIDRQRPDLNTLLTAYVHGWANEADLMDLLLGPRPVTRHWYQKDNDDPLLTAEYDELKEFTARTPPKPFAATPELAALADRIRAHLLELELTRGETPTPATAASRYLGALVGTDTLLRLIGALGGKPFKIDSGYYWRPSLDRSGILSTLVVRTHPAPTDTPESFATAVRAAIDAGIFPEERLLDLAFLAPQWLPFVEKALGWAGVAEGVWWFLAHMPRGNEGVVEDDANEVEESDGDTDTDSDEEKEKPSAWERLIRQRTPLTPAERGEGAVDVQWFHRTYALVGPERWAQLTSAAKYGGSGRDHKKPALIAEVLLGQAKKSEIVTAIAKRRLRESVRLLGLMPLATGDKFEADLRDRYEVLQEYAKYARSLGSMSRASAVRASEIGIANLARTAGYPDAVRFEWEMEAQSVADLAAGPQSVTVTGVTVTLALEDGKPSLTVSKNGKPLKAIPPAVKKNEKVAEMAARKQHLTRQGSRVRKSLEAMMCRGDEFTAEELKKLMTHPLIAPLLGRLVLVGEGIAGYPSAGGKALETHAGKLEPVKKTEKLRIAHPADLYATGEWEKWQHDCFARERVQPFKQVFRELYLLTAQEKADKNVSHRYAGQQVQPKKGSALLNGRGWSTEDYTRTFHEAGIRCSFTVRHGGWTALDVEGWTIEDIRFYRRDIWEPMPLADVPPRVFSEAMRDLDLVVSVAHSGQVDPEASASTVEMRSALIRETCQLLRMPNVRVEKNHAFVDGQLGQYSVHLGSGTVHRLPGGSVCIVPVHAQHRGRLFLPFADDDPRTAEVTSKVMLLARDNEIQDPTILQQLLAK